MLACGIPSVVTAEVSAPCRVPPAFLDFSVDLPVLRAAARDRGTVRILMVGSKITGPDQTERRGEKLKAELERRIPGATFEIESGGPGAFMADVQFDRLRSDLDHIQPQLVIWQAGSAEALAGSDAGEFEATLRDAAAWITAHGIDQILVDPPYVAGVDHEQSYWPIVARISAAADQARVNVFRRYAVTQALAAGTSLRGGRRGCVPELLAEAILRALDRTP